MAFLELVTLLPPGAPSQTRLARHGQRLVVLRELKEGTAAFYPDESPHLVTVQEVGELQGKRHALFPFVPGVTLRDLVEAFTAHGKPAPLGLVGGVVLAAARALAAHQPPRPHGGLHDAALQVAFTGETYVLDFGAPRVTRFKALGRDSLSADVFALGGVLHAALTGYTGAYVNPPSPLPRPSAVHPEATPALDDVVLRALSAQVPARQADVKTLAAELEVVLPSPYSPAELAALANSLFQDRVRLLQSLSGLTEPDAAPALGDEPEEPATASHRAPPSGPLPPVPLTTEPGGHYSDGTSPGVRLPWLVDDVPGADEVEDGGTQPRIEAPQGREELTNPGAPPPEPRPGRRPEPMPSGEGSRATADRLPQVGARSAAPSEETDAGHLRPRPSAANLRAMSDETDAGQRAPRPSAANLRAMSDETDAGQRAPRPGASAPRVPSEDTDAAPRAPRASAPVARGLPGEAAGGHQAPRPSAANLRPLTDGDVASRPPVRASASNLKPSTDDTDPGRAPRGVVPPPRPSGARQALDAPAPPALAEDTAPRARAPAPTEDTAPRARVPAPDLSGPRNTTTHERLRAAGQERVATPPAGTPAVGLGDEVEAMPTALRPRIAAPPVDDAQVHAQTMQKLTVVPEPRGGHRGLIALLLVVIAALGSLWAMKEGRLPAPKPLADLLGLGLEPDAGAPAEELDAGAAVAPVAEASDAGLLAEADGGAPESLDAGLALVALGDAGALDGGLGDAGAADAGAADAGAADAGAVDGGVSTAAGAGLDGGVADAGAVDAGEPDAGADKGKATSKPPKKKRKR